MKRRDFSLATVAAVAATGLALPHKRIEGADLVSAVVHVDQTPLGRTSRGNPATYLQIWDVLRKRFAAHPLAKERDYGPGFFSFNVAGGTKGWIQSGRAVVSGDAPT